eukprot:5962023-Karenia_brevis.AAC.1
MCKGRVMTIIGCTRFEDPDRSEETRHHTGHHPRTLLHVAQSENFATAMAPLSALRTDVKHLVIFVCRKGTHVSVAANDLGQHCCEWLY